MTTPVVSQLAPGVEVLNDLLVGLLLTPVASLDNLPADSDAYICLTRLAVQHRRIAARGWHCFNKRERVSLTYAAGQYTVTGALSVTTSPRRPSDPEWPQTRGEYLSAGVQRIVRMDNGTTTFATAEQDILFDVIYGLDFANAPPPYQEYLVAATHNVLAPIYAVNVDRAREDRALNELIRHEIPFMPPANVYTDTAAALLLGYR